MSQALNHYFQSFDCAHILKLEGAEGTHKESIGITPLLEESLEHYKS